MTSRPPSPEPMAGDPFATPLRFERVVFFSDAVFAIAVTLLVIDLRPADGSYARALEAYLNNPTPFIAIAIGFLVVGSYWMSHRAIFALLHATNGPTIWANLVFLFWVAIQPFFTAALAEPEPTQTSVVAYATCQVLAGISQLALWWIAIRSPGLTTPRATPRLVRYVTFQLARAPLAFGISIPITLLGGQAIGPTLGMASWGLVVAIGLVLRLPFRDVARGPDSPIVQRAVPSSAGGR